ncbi:hypothetical protein F0L74_09990 [Chitinophaga agrisoli]|uniref:Winged helix-turn-helix domain-containing protein n=1 Tax=Chitinophaga agrisoli TaxID=2607653 RepID=A0A5B2VXU1_9BACT|nr:hypothetical protein F0L74_09990 [Chitinophaga agrisoli]
MQQLTLQFETCSPINVDKLCKQNKQVYDHLSSGRTLTLLQADHLYGIRHLHSRISDLRNRNNIRIYDRTITVPDRHGIKVKCKEYSLNQFTN